MSVTVYNNVGSLKGFSLKNCPAMPAPTGVLMCPPNYYDVVDVKNPYMMGQMGKVDRARARRQWDDLHAAFVEVGLTVSLIEPQPHLEDMVFCANQTLVGLTLDGERLCVLGSMRHPSRRREVAAFEAWFSAAGYRTLTLKDKGGSFEGAGDAVWHPGKRLLWGGYGFRSSPQVYDEVARAFKTPVILLKLVNERFFHLDTCFCPLTPESVLIYPAAFDAGSLELILKMFPVVITASETEAVRHMVCNAAVVGSTAIIPSGCTAVIKHMEAMNLKIREVDTSEFIKSGGSVYCLKMFLH